MPSIVKLIMTLLVKNEEDIISSNIEFHLSRGVDYIIATDNGSTDRTTEILLKYQEIGKLHYIHRPEKNFQQAQWVTHMAHLAASDFKADWIINNDADEFWWPEQGDLKDAILSVTPAAEALRAQRINFLPRRSNGDCIHFSERLIIRRPQSKNFLGGRLPGKICHRALHNITVDSGAHNVQKNGVALKPQPVPITILHFPIRTHAQFVNKVTKMGMAISRNRALPFISTGVYRKLFSLWLLGGLDHWYESELLNEETLSDHLADGRLIRDERLKHALSSIKDRYWSE